MIYTRESVMRLVEEKDRIEQTLKDLWDILKNNNIGMTEALVDNEGFPRNDIDVYQVRHSRHQIKCLQNDHSGLMKRIEEGLAIVMGPNCIPNSDPNAATITDLTPTVTSDAFAKVDSVAPASPALLAGLREGDQIIKFGSVTSENFRGMNDIGNIVQHSRNTPVQVAVLRGNNSSVTLYVTPRQWPGRGLLGCNIVPIDKIER